MSSSPLEIDYDDIDNDELALTTRTVNEADKYTGSNLPPTINCKSSDENESVFLKCLAGLHKTTVDNIQYRIEGAWKIYTINGAQIFKDRC